MSKQKLLIFVACGVIITHSSMLFANNKIEAFLFDCEPDGFYNVELMFAPVEKTTNGGKSKWSYRFLNEGSRIYTDEQRKLPNDRALKVDLVSILKKRRKHK
uniref:Uncharacterized protein n=1 Tax=Candidatus Kentrum sp. LPFa TaxID=2126335 RepID=A0A450XEW1_9GAMM|nr:MAG: hypothetical protein BECKLPF1236A_GA0070988_106022 [Candidatus Kentron sp. LPFa]VFK36200.1 MAG: hypothetical protein BECKLPF1236C_GA0070990_105182 [Candidatus Kentron sp. LPFa]